MNAAADGASGDRKQNGLPEREKSFFSNFLNFAADIKLAHSIFALPFAATAIVLSKSTFPSLVLIFLLVICMVFARSFAMGINRYLDREIDAQNPRTKIRKIPSGQMSANSSLFWTLLSGVLFVISAFRINEKCGWLSIPLLVILGGYSMMKKISWLTHWYLGMCLGLAPIAVSIALTDSIAVPVLLIGVGVMFWTAGFDILYSLQDREFDQQEKLKSFPAKFGAWNSVIASRVCFVVMVVSLAAAGILSDSGFIYFLATAIVGLILTYEHWLVRDVKANGVSKNINAAFFNVNAWVSVCFYILVQIDHII